MRLHLLPPQLAALILPLAAEREERVESSLDIKVSLFFSSNINESLKKINLVDLSQREGQELLGLLAKNQRFAIVVEKGDRVFAHVPRDWAEEWQEHSPGDLSLKDKKLTVYTLSEQEASSLRASLVELFALFQATLQPQRLNSTEISSTSFKATLLTKDLLEGKKRLFAVKNGGWLRVNIRQSFHKILIDMMRKFSEERRQEVKEQKKEEEKKEIRNREIQRSLERARINEQENRRSSGR